MKSILISINPQYVDKIMNGEKEYEYRKIKCKAEVDKMYIYSTIPVKKVVGEAKIECILEGSPQEIWERTKSKSGVSKEFFDSYFRFNKQAYAYKLYDIIKYDKPKDIKEFGVNYAPQLFCYVDM